LSYQKETIIELDGQPAFGTNRHDEERTDTCQSQGYKVIRFWNNAVMKESKADARIQNEIKEMH